MPRSFLVKKPSSHKIPNYGQLESRREIGDTLDSSSGLLPPILFQNEAAPPVCCESLMYRSSVITRISLDTDNRGASGYSPRTQDILLDSTLTQRAPVTPLKDTLNNLNLPPLLIPTKRPELGCSGGGRKEVSDKLHGVQNGSAEETPGRFECFDCRRPYHTFSGLAKHRQLHCELDSRKHFSCKYCEKEYVSLGALKMHIRTHTLPCVCKICSKAFSRPWLLQGHIRTHTGEKPFACLHCSRAFADRSNLRAHLQTHSDIKKYQCRSCTKTFSRISLLSKHEETGCNRMSPQSPFTMSWDSKCPAP